MSATPSISPSEMIALDSRLDMAAYNVRRSLVKMRGCLEIDQVTVMPETFLREYRDRVAALQRVIADLEQVGSEKSDSLAPIGESRGDQLV